MRSIVSPRSALLGLLVFLSVISSDCLWAGDYYFDSLGGSDANNGASAQAPFKSLDKLNTIAFKPGDKILLKAGSTWMVREDGPRLGNSGLKDAPIVLTAYGNGPKPVINAVNHLDGEGMKIDGSFLVVDGLMVTGAKEAAIVIGPGADHNIISNCEISDSGVGVEIDGQYNQITRNHIHDLQMIKNTPGGDDDYGAVGVWIENSHNEVSYNKIVKCKSPSHDYGVDGGALEFYSDKYPVRHNRVHHNFIADCEGVFESGGPGGLVGDNVFYHNVCLNNRILFDIHVGDNLRRGENIFRIENNTIVEIRDYQEMEYYVFGFNGKPHPETVMLRNNIFYIKDYWFLAPADKEGWAVKQEHNLYYLANSKSELGFARARGDQVNDPLFVDIESGDFRLKPGSPALDAGVDLGYSLDFEDKPVPSGQGPDMGAFEYQTK